MSETCWAHKKWNKIPSDIKLVFYSSTINLRDTYSSELWCWRHNFGVDVTTVVLTSQLWCWRHNCGSLQQAKQSCITFPPPKRIQLCTIHTSYSRRSRVLILNRESVIFTDIWIVHPNFREKFIDSSFKKASICFPNFYFITYQLDQSRYSWDYANNVGSSEEVRSLLRG